MERIIIFRDHWNTTSVKECHQLTHIFLLCSSKMAVRAKKTFTLKEYKEVTGTVGIFKKISFNAQIHAIYERYLKAPKTKSYIHIPIWYFRIPLKSKFKKKVAHYKVTKDHDASKRGAKYLFSEFAEKYGVKVNRDFRYKFKKIIKEL